ncbi:B- and T-lymphocyte attenuator-like isoform X2 [Cyclopterus lumpus]|uniref:B- and T-lymphocyte attenuator-like isoform X2 n=1 Tax=Cyclopterus lumpus TaxID=8103 RepID=UPI001486BCF9|nr:B- and T-lymphocyte attenuator-like isoform X2 [Cyclopterus lumpus]
MRPKHRWTVLHVFILAGMLLTLKADGEDPDCEVEVKVRQNTSYEAVVGEELRINCTVEFCSDAPPPVSWYKRGTTDVRVSFSGHIKTEWKLLNPFLGTTFLIFQKVHRNDSGVGEPANVTENNDTSGTTREPKGYTWLYVYSAAGVGAFVIIVIIMSVVSMRGCEGKSKKEKQTENQYTAIPMVERPASHASGLQPPPPSRRSSRGKTPPSQPNEVPSPGGNEHAYDWLREEVGGSVVYAALNHRLPAAARPWRPSKEASEYAAIRVKEPSPTRLNHFKDKDISR